MRNTWAVLKREFAGFFITPIGYVIVTVYAIISGIADAVSAPRDWSFPDRWDGKVSARVARALANGIVPLAD